MDGVLVVRGSDGCVVLVNPAAHRLLGFDDGRLIGLHYSDLFPPMSDMTTDELLSTICEHDGVFSQEFEPQRGENRILDLMANMFEDDDQNLILVTLRDTRERRQAERERDRLLTELESSLAEVRTLSGMIPICAWCKRVREDEGFWTQIEEFVAEHSGADFTHGLCPDCAEKVFTQIEDDDRGGR